jgi:hypothetical protein
MDRSTKDGEEGISCLTLGYLLLTRVRYLLLDRYGEESKEGNFFS